MTVFPHKIDKLWQGYGKVVSPCNLRFVNFKIQGCDKVAAPCDLYGLVKMRFVY